MKTRDRFNPSFTWYSYMSSSTRHFHKGRIWSQSKAGGHFSLHAKLVLPRILKELFITSNTYVIVPSFASKTTSQSATRHCSLTHNYNAAFGLGGLGTEPDVMFPPPLRQHQVSLLKPLANTNWIISLCIRKSLSHASYHRPQLKA